MDELPRDEGHGILYVLDAIMTFVMTVMMSIGGFLVSRLGSHGEKLSGLHQNLIDLRETIARLHVERVDAISGITRRLDSIEERLRQVESNTARH